MEDRTRAYHQMAIAILAIATAALGFALWSQDFDLAYPQADALDIIVFYWVQVAGPFVVVTLYFITFLSVGRFLMQPYQLTGPDLVRRPLVWLYWQMIALALLFLAGFLSDLSTALDTGNAMPVD